MYITPRHTLELHEVIRQTCVNFMSITFCIIFSISKFISGVSAVRVNQSKVASHENDNNIWFMDPISPESSLTILSWLIAVSDTFHNKF